MNISKHVNLDRIWAFAVIFINGWTFALPITDEPMPIWLTPVQFIHGIFIHEILIMIYLVYLLITRGLYQPIQTSHARDIFFIIAGIGCLGILSTGVNIRPLKEVAGACRYFLLAAYFLLSIYWAKRHGPTFVLRTFLIGIACSGAINLYLSFNVRWSELGGLPFLLGQNGPGGPLGLSVILSAWLMLERKTSLDATIALASCFIGLFAASISYSKLSMLMAGSGLIAWVGVLLLTLAKRRSRRLSAVLFAILLAVAIVYKGEVSQYVQGVNAFIDHKFSGSITEDRSVETRSQYFIITAEIMSSNPLFGVGSGGFYDGVMATESSKSSRSYEEDPEKGEKGGSNPHNSFLYYASANGFPGLLLVGLLFMMTLQAFWRYLSGRGVAGSVLWGCLAVGYLIFGMTLPTLFNTSILYLPTAVAVVLTRQAMKNEVAGLVG